MLIQSEHSGKKSWTCDICNTVYIANHNLSNGICACQVDESQRGVALALLSGNKASIKKALMSSGSVLQNNKKLPSTIQMATNLARSISEWVLNGSRVASKEQVDQRLGTCSSCEFMIIKKGSQRCTHKQCGCFLTKKSKLMVSINGSDCPVGKWPVIT